MAQKAINKMDGLLVGGSKLKVTFAKFGRTLNGEKKHGANQSRSKLIQEDKPSKKNFIPPNRKGLMDGRKFVEVVNQVGYSKREDGAKTKNREENRNITMTQEKEGEVHPNITVSPDDDKLEWLRRSMIAFTKHKIDAKQLRMELQKNNILYESLIPWGEFKFIVVIRSSEDRNEAVTKTITSGIEGITGVRPWKEDDTIFTNEGMWFTCVGVPIQCWTEPTFHKIGSLWSKVLAIHVGNTFDQAWIQLETGELIGPQTKSLSTTIWCEKIRFPIKLTAMDHPNENKNRASNMRQGSNYIRCCEEDDRRETDDNGGASRSQQDFGSPRLKDLATPDTHTAIENLNSPSISAHACALMSSKRQRRLDDSENACGEGIYGHVSELSKSTTREWKKKGQYREGNGGHVSELSKTKTKEWRKKGQNGLAEEHEISKQSVEIEIGPTANLSLEARKNELEWLIENDFFNLEPLLIKSLAQNTQGAQSSSTDVGEARLQMEEWAQRGTSTFNNFTSQQEEAVADRQGKLNFEEENEDRRQRMEDGDLHPMIDGSPAPRFATTAQIQEVEGDNEKQRLAVDGHYLEEQANSCTISEVGIERSADKVMISIPQTNYLSPAKIVRPINGGGKMMTTNEVIPTVDSEAIWGSKRKGCGDIINADYLSIESLPQYDEEPSFPPGFESLPQYDEEPRFPPGFEPQQLSKPHENEIETDLVDGEREYEATVLSHATEKTKSTKDSESIRLTRRLAKDMERKEEEDMEKLEAEQTWALGKQLGLYADDERAVIKGLMMEGTGTENAKPRKRGRPRKVK